jgi:hypothetical protein
MAAPSIIVCTSCFQPIFVSLPKGRCRDLPNGTAVVLRECGAAKIVAP